MTANEHTCLDSDAKFEQIRKRLQEKPDGVLETIAVELQVPLIDVVAALDDHQRTRISGAEFECVWDELSTWGEVLFLVHIPDRLVLECTAPLVKGEFGRGYYNFHSAHMGGHIAASAIEAIYAVDRPFHGRRSCSLHFYDDKGQAVFKVFVRRNPDRSLDDAQCKRFEQLVERFRLGACAASA